MFHVKHFMPLLRRKYQELYASLLESAAELHPPYPSELTETQCESLLTYLGLLIEWTKKIDLVAEADTEVLLERHLIDSLAAGILVAALVDCGPILDVGSGAGLPGVVFALMQPDRPLYLLEPREKRSIFLAEIKRRLALPNAVVIRSRLEDLSAQLSAQKGIQPAVAATFRALVPTAELCKSAAQNLAHGGLLVYLSSPRTEPASVQGLNWQQIKYTLGLNGPARILFYSRIANS